MNNEQDIEVELSIEQDTLNQLQIKADEQKIDIGRLTAIGALFIMNNEQDIEVELSIEQDTFDQLQIKADEQNIDVEQLIVNILNDDCLSRRE